MKPTLKSINAALPRFDVIRRHWMTYGTTGWTDGREFLASAFADLDESGNVVDITMYAASSGMEPRHYYSERYPETVVDITDQISEVIDHHDDCSAKKFRAKIVNAIQAKIAEEINHREDKE